MKRVLSVVLACGLVAAVFAPVLAAPAGVTCSGQQYTVVPGDNLFRIGVTFSVPWPQIAAANSLSNPSLIFPGQVLCIPAAGSGTPAATAISSNTPLPTDTGTPEITDTPVGTDTGTPEITDTPVATDTGTPEMTDTPEATENGTGTPVATDTSEAPTATAVATPTPVPTVAPAPVAVVVPTFSIVSVVKGTSVTIQTANFPANQDFNVTMGPIGNLGLSGVAVTTTNSGTGGVVTATFTIPAQLAGTSQIAIRLQSASGYYAFNWFWNATAP